MKSLVTQIFIFISFIALLLFGIFGTITPDKLLTQAVGIMQIGAFESGLALYQGNRGIFYAISPFNDYIVYENNELTTLITSDEINKKLYTSSHNQSHSQNIITGLQSSILSISPAIQFNTETLNTNYTTKINGNTVIITRTTDIKNNKRPTIQAITIPYRGGDFVFDTTGQMYYFHLEEDVKRFERIYNIKLQQNNFDLRINLGEKPIIIINPSLTGAIVISPQKNQQLWVDKNIKMIQLEEPIINDSITMNMNLHIYNNPQEAITQLLMNK